MLICQAEEAKCCEQESLVGDPLVLFPPLTFGRNHLGVHLYDPYNVLFQLHVCRLYPCQHISLKGSLRIKSTHQVIWFLSWWVPDNDHSMLHLDSVREHWPLLKSPLFINLWEKPHNRTISTANPFPIPELLIWLQSTLNIRTNTSLLFNMLSVETLTLTRTW